MQRRAVPGPGRHVSVRNLQTNRGRRASAPKRNAAGPIGVFSLLVLLGGSAGAMWELGRTGMPGAGVEQGSYTLPLPVQAGPDGQGCSQARIDRGNGQTVLGECPAQRLAPNAATTALLADPANSR
jgi:hypothetical protein